MDDKSQFNESLGLFERSPERKVCEKYEWPELVGKEAYQAEELIKQDNVEELYLNKAWRPNLSITGADGLPPVAIAGNVCRPSTTCRCSMRLCPVFDAH
jgi:hypothetical protein